MYWEYILVWKKYETFKKLGNQFKEIFKFSLLILTPFTIIGFFLYISLGLYFLLKKQLFIILKNKIKKINNIILLKRILTSFINFLKYITVLRILFINLETGEHILSFLYKKFYNICAIIQKNLYYIKGAFILGYNKNNNIFLGIKNIFKYINLKYKAYIERKKIIKNNKKLIKKNWKNYFIEQKKGITFKINLILILWDFKASMKNMQLKIIKWIYKYIIYSFFKIDYITFYNSYNKNIFWLKKKYINLYNNFILLKVLITRLSIWEFLKLLLSFIWEFIKLPIKFINNYYKSIILENYKKGIKLNFWSILKFIKLMQKMFLISWWS